MSEFQSIGNNLSKRKSNYDKAESRTALKLWLPAKYVRSGYLATAPHSTTAILIAILNVADWTKNPRSCKCRIGRFMELGGVKNKNTAFRAIKWLEALKIISVKRVYGEPNFYEVNKPSLWITLPTSIKNDN